MVEFLSPSSVNTYLGCPRRFYYRYIVRVPDRPNRYSVKGLIIHEIIEEFLSKYEKSLKKRLDRITKKIATKEKFEVFEMSEEEIDYELKDIDLIIRSFYNMFRMKMRMALFQEKAKNEQHAFYLIRPKYQEIEIQDDHLKLRGRIDTIEKTFSGKTIIGDYKTSSMYGICPKEDHMRQIAMYSLLYYKKHLRFPDYACLYYLRYGEKYYFEVTPSMISEAESLVKYVWNEIDSKSEMIEFPKKEGNLCGYCPFLEQCIKDGKEKKTESKLFEMKKKEVGEI